MLGIADPHGAWAALEHGLGRPVFEVPTLPPSVPGMRLFAILREALRRAGGTVVLNNVVVGAERDGRRVRALRVRIGLREERRGADWVVLATGGFASGGLELDSRWATRETALGLPVTGVPAAGEERFRPGYFEDHPIARAGVAVDHELRPLDAGGEPVLENVPGRRRDAGRRRAVEGEVRRRAQPRHGPPRGRAGAGRLDHRGGRAGRGREELIAMAVHEGDVLGTLLMREVARPLRQVHDLRDALPGLQRHAAVPGTEVRRAAGRALPGRGDEPSPDASLDYCSGCGICTQVCPQGVHIAEINTQARAALKATHGVPLRDRILARPTLAGRLGTPVAPIANWALRNRLLRLAAERTLGIHHRAPMPHFAGARSSAGPGSTRRPPRSAAWPSSTAAGPTTTSRGSAR